MRRGMVLALLLVGACGAPAPTETPSPAVSSAPAFPSSAPVSPAPRPTYHRDDFLDPDAWPTGALRRYGSRKFHGNDALALLDNGWLVEGTKVWRADGHATRWSEHRFLGRRDNDLAVLERHTVHWLRPDGNSIGDVKLDCEDHSPWLASDGKHIFCRDGNQDPDEQHFVRVFDASTAAQRCKLPLDRHRAGPSFAAVANVLVTEESRGDERNLVAYDLGTCKRRWRAPWNDANGVALAADASSLFVIDGHGQLVAYAAETGEPQWRFALPPWKFGAPLRVSSDGRHIAFSMLRAREDATSVERIGLLDLTTRGVRVVAEGSARQLEFSPRGSELAMEMDGELRVMEVATGKVQYEPSFPHRDLVGASTYGELVVSVSRDGWLETWDRDTGTSRIDRKISDEASDVYFLPPPRLGLVGGWPAAYRIFDVTTGEQQCVHQVEDADHVFRWPGGEVALVEDAVRSADGHFMSRVTAVGTDCGVIGQHEIEGRIVDANFTPKQVVELVVANGTEREEPSHLWIVRWSTASGTPTEIPGSRGPVEGWGAPNYSYTPVKDDEHYLIRDDGTHELVGEYAVVNVASPIAVAVTYSHYSGPREVVVFDRATGRLREKLLLPPSTSLSRASIDDTGRWLTVIDDATVLLYPLTP